MIFFKYLFIPFLLISSLSFAQKPEEGSTGDLLLYRNEVQWGAFAHDKGLGVYFRKGNHKTGTIKRFLEADFLNMKHPKEFKSDNPFENGRYVYGKVNSLLLLRTGFGHQVVLNGKDHRKGVEVRYHYFIGSSLGLLKPVYLEIIHNENNNRRIVPEKHDPDIHHVSNIFGRSPFTKGIDELKLEPGIYGKFGFSFEYSAFDDVVRALETGIVIDAFRRKVPVMGIIPNNQVFASFYISVVFGKREF